jgi:hypothetical protein
MEPLLPPSPATGPVANRAAQQIIVLPQAAVGETTGLKQECAEWPPITGQTVEVYSRRLRQWVPARITRIAGDEATVTYKEGSKRGTKSVAVADHRMMRWSLRAWLEMYHLGGYTEALADEGYDGHPGYICAIGEQELEDLVLAVGMKRPQAKVFRQAVLDLNEPRPEQTTNQLLADKSSESSDGSADGYPYESVTMPTAPVGLVGGTQRADTERGASASRVILLIVVLLAIVGVGGYFGCEHNVVPASVCFGIGGTGGGEPEPEPTPAPGPAPAPEPEPGPGPVSLLAQAQISLSVG